MTRKSISLSTKLAAALLRIKNADGSYLIPEPYRSSGTAESILRCVEWDHGVLHAHGGSDAPQNLWPMLTAGHREKSRGDTSKAAKAKRISAEHEAFKSRVLARKLQDEVDAIKEGKGEKRKARISSGGFRKDKRKLMNGKVVDR